MVFSCPRNINFNSGLVECRTKSDRAVTNSIQLLVHRTGTIRSGASPATASNVFKLLLDLYVLKSFSIFEPELK